MFDLLQQISAPFVQAWMAICYPSSFEQLLDRVKMFLWK